MQHVVMPEGKVLRMSAEDLVAAFYLFRLPQGWAERMCFQRKVPFQSLGIDQEGDTYIGATVLPMGWNSAVGVMQHAHRRLALRSPIRGGAGLLGMCEVRDAIFPDLEHHEGIWSLYLDDTNVMEVLDAKLAKELEGTPADEQKRLRAAYEHWGIPTSLEKTVMRARKAEKLGAIIDGDAGMLRGSTKRALESLSLGTWILGQERVARKALQVFCGKEVHTMQFRRPVFGVFDYIWKAIGDGREYVELGPKVVEEILMAGCLQVMRFTDLRAQLDPIVTASDACESGGGMVYSHKLTYEGLLEAVALEEGEADLPTEKMKIDDEQHILVIDFFAGIGGLSQALHLAGIKPDHTLVVEQDPDCRRLHRARWPGCEFINDITKLEKKDIEKAMRRVPNLTGVISGGGSPCQGLSKLSSERQHLEDPRSALFFTLAKALDSVHELAKELNIWEIKFVENVVGDEEDIRAMSETLGRRPVLVCSSGVSRVRRPRLYWCDVELQGHPSYEWREHHSYDELIFAQKQSRSSPSPTKAGHGLEGRKMRGSGCLPSHVPSRDETEPAGIEMCSSQTLELWKADQMKFPPYTYLPLYLFVEKGGERKRVACADERERLMGFPTGYKRLAGWPLLGMLSMPWW